MLAADLCLTALCLMCVFLQEITFPKMVANCCRFLCYFCRISRQNQKAMFDHLSYLLENSSVGLGELCVPYIYIHIYICVSARFWLLCYFYLI